MVKFSLLQGIRERPPGLIQHVLSVLNFLAAGAAGARLTAPWTFAWICCPQLPHHPRKNGTHSTSLSSTGGHTPKGSLTAQNSVNVRQNSPEESNRPFQTVPEPFLETFGPPVVHTLLWFWAPPRQDSASGLHLRTPGRFTTRPLPVYFTTTMSVVRPFSVLSKDEIGP